MGLSNVLTTTASENTKTTNTTIETSFTSSKSINKPKTKPKSILKPYTPREDTNTIEELQEKLESLPEPLIKSLKEAMKNRADIQILTESETLIKNFKRSKNTNYALTH